MEAPRERPPEYVSHDPDELKLPSVPRHEIGSPRQPPADLTLPGLSSILAGMPNQGATATAYDANNQTHALRADHLARLDGRTLPSITSRAFSPAPLRTSSEFAALMSPTDTGSVMSVDEQGNRGASIVSIEDPDVRMAAEALSGLGNPEFNRTAKQPQAAPRQNAQASTAPRRSKEPEEPLLQLLIETHPWVGGTINGSLSAYTTTKHYTPKFVQYSANLLERGVVNTVTSVGRHTGVESGIRSYLGNRRPSDAQQGRAKEGQRKRRRDEQDSMEIDGEEATAMDDSPSRTRYEYLPAYRNSKPPSYREEASPADLERGAPRDDQDRSWGSKLLVSTSGLGVALHDTSLRSLTYCTQTLTKSANHVELVLNALKVVLQDYEKARDQREQEKASNDKAVEAGMAPGQSRQDQATRHLANRIESLCSEIWRTFQTVVEQVSRYAGAALPENARQLVKGQLLSIPGRWRWASEQAEATSADVPTKAAHRMIAFATEGLDMMGQVNGVVQITLQSAEDWLNTFGRKRRAQMVHGDVHGHPQQSQYSPGSNSNQQAFAGAEAAGHGVQVSGR